METLGGTCYCVLILVGVALIAQFFMDVSLKTKNKDLKRFLKDRDSVIKELLSSLEAFGVYHIDGDAEPIEIEGYTVYSHKKNGLTKFDLSSFSFYVPDEQNDRGMSGHSLHEEIIDKNVANDIFLDFLLSHQNLIPKSWPEEVVFWGTIRCKDVDKETKYYVRSLVYSEGVYKSKIKEVDSFFDKNQPAMIMN